MFFFSFLVIYFWFIKAKRIGWEFTQNWSELNLTKGKGNILRKFFIITLSRLSFSTNDLECRWSHLEQLLTLCDVHLLGITRCPFYVHPFHSQEWSITNFPWSLIRVWPFIAFSDERWLYYTSSHFITYTFESSKRSGLFTSAVKAISYSFRLIWILAKYHWRRSADSVSIESRPVGFWGLKYTWSVSAVRLRSPVTERQVHYLGPVSTSRDLTVSIVV